MADAITPGGEAPSPLTPAEREEIRQREQAATEGPWRVEPFEGDGWTLHTLWSPGEAYPSGSRSPGVLVARTCFAPASERNAAFIAAARTDVPRLLDTVEEQARELERLRGERDRLARKLAVGLYDVPHSNDGDCPDVDRPDARDANCPACRFLLSLTPGSAEAAPQPAPTPHPTDQDLSSPSGEEPHV